MTGPTSRRGNPAAALLRKIRGFRRIRFTRSGALFAVGALAVGLAAVNTGNNLLYLILGAMLGAILVSGWLSERTIGGLRVHRYNPRPATVGTSLGLSYRDKMRYVILPQALRRVLPPLGNQFVYMLKMSALASVIGFHELTRRASELVVNQYRPLEIYTFLILEYLVLILIVSWGVRALERRMRADESQAR